MECYEGRTYLSKIWFVSGMVGPLPVNIMWRLYAPHDGHADWVVERTFRILVDEKVGYESTDPMRIDTFTNRCKHKHSESEAIETWNETVEKTMALMDSAELEVCELHTSNMMEVVDKLAKTSFAHIGVVENPHKGDRNNN